jgi:TonB family protein
MRRRILGVLCVFSLAIPFSLSAQQPTDPVYESQDGVTLPKVVKDIKPYYTPDAMADRVQGSVVLQCVVSKAGVPTDIEVKQTLDERLDKQAIAALEQWRFEPGQKDGAAVNVRIAVEMTFTLK